MNNNIFGNSKIKMYKNMPDLVAEALKEGILQGQFKGGVQLKQDEIAKQFDVSLIPVREALIHLQSQKLVRCIRNKGAVVTTLSIKDMQNTFEMWKLLEAGLGSLTNKELGEEELQKLIALNRKMRQEETVFEFNRHNRLFHELVCNGRANEEIVEMYDNVFIRVERYLIYIDYLVPIRELVVSYQQEIIEHFKVNQYDLASKLTLKYIEQIYQMFIDYIEQYHDIEGLDFNQFLPFVEQPHQIGI